MFTYLLSLIVIPHGITDIIVSYEMEAIHTMLVLYSIVPFTLMYANKSLYRFIFVGTSFIHFSHSLFSVVPYFIMILFFMGQIDYYEGIHYITLYLSFIHTPEHYYEVFYSTQYVYEHLYVIFSMTIISAKLSPLLIDWIVINKGEDRLSKYIGGIIMSHILFNEHLMLPN
jgi:hypothetical protein